MRRISYRAPNFSAPRWPACGETGNGGGPIWAIFDSAAIQREVDRGRSVGGRAGRFLLQQNSIEELAARVINKCQSKPMPAAALAATVAGYNNFVDTGRTRISQTHAENKDPNAAVLRRLGDAGCS
jgi:hypothetical protein